MIDHNLNSPPKRKVFMSWVLLNLRNKLIKNRSRMFYLRKGRLKDHHGHARLRQFPKWPISQFLHQPVPTVMLIIPSRASPPHTPWLVSNVNNLPCDIIHKFLCECGWNHKSWQLVSSLWSQNWIQLWRTFRDYFMSLIHNQWKRPHVTTCIELGWNLQCIGPHTWSWGLHCLSLNGDLPLRKIKKGQTRFLIQRIPIKITEPRRFIPSKIAGKPTRTSFPIMFLTRHTIRMGLLFCPHSLSSSFIVRVKIRITIRHCLQVLRHTAKAQECNGGCSKTIHKWCKRSANHDGTAQTPDTSQLQSSRRVPEGNSRAIATAINGGQLLNYGGLAPGAFERCAGRLSSSLSWATLSQNGYGLRFHPIGSSISTCPRSILPTKNNSKLQVLIQKYWKHGGSSLIRISKQHKHNDIRFCCHIGYLPRLLQQTPVLPCWRWYTSLWLVSNHGPPSHPWLQSF